MIFWPVYIPLVTIIFILYFENFDSIFSGRKKHLKIDPKDDLRGKKWEKIATSINLFIFSTAGLAVALLQIYGNTLIYHEVSYTFSSIAYLPASFFLALAIHDFYFYLTHRLLHTPWLFRKVHITHHKSHSPNAWSAFSFHPVEGVLQIGIVPLVAFILPIHEAVLIVFTAFLLFMSVYGHSAYELRPDKMKIFSLFNTSLHHYQHHKFTKYNFGIYLNLWDRIFKSIYPKYEESFETLRKEITKRQDSSY